MLPSTSRLFETSCLNLAYYFFYLCFLADFSSIPNASATLDPTGSFVGYFSLLIFFITYMRVMAM